jgi:hypothetical protein
MLRVEVWKAAALSLDIDPDKVRLDPISQMHGMRLFEESQDFWDRIDVTCGNLRSVQTGTPAEGALDTIPQDEPADCKVKLTQFAAWCVSIGWPIPEELRAMASQPTQAAQPHSEGKPLDGRRFSSLARIVAALATQHGDINLRDSSAVKVIQALTEQSGAPVSENTVRSCLREIRKALETS